MPSLPTLDLHKAGDGVRTFTFLSQYFRFRASLSLSLFCLTTCYSYYCSIHTLTYNTTYLLDVVPAWCHWVSRPAEQHKGGCAICSLWFGVWVGPKGAKTAVWCRRRLGSLPNRQPLHQQQVFGSSHYYNWCSNRYDSSVRYGSGSYPAKKINK